MAKSLSALTVPLDEDLLVAQADHLLSQISDMAHSVHRLAVNISGDGEDDVNMASAIMAMASQIQFLADLAQEKLGSPVKPNAADYRHHRRTLNLNRE